MGQDGGSSDENSSINSVYSSNSSSSSGSNSDSSSSSGSNSDSSSGSSSSSSSSSSSVSDISQPVQIIDLEQGNNGYESILKEYNELKGTTNYRYSYYCDLTLEEDTDQKSQVK